MKKILLVLMILSVQIINALPADIELNYKEKLNNAASMDYFDQAEALGLLEEYEWLYRKLIPETDRKQFPKRSERTFIPHLRDSLKLFPQPERIQNAKFNRNGTYHVDGYLNYVVIFPKKYNYTVVKENDLYTIIVNVHFSNANLKDIKRLNGFFKLAEELWNSHSHDFDFNYKFQFNAVTDKKKSHFSVRLVDNTRGPYDIQWDRDWNYRTIAHELGHMMGVGDEYKTLSGKIDCLSNSIMCISWGTPQKQHYYHILRRLLD